MPLTIHARHWLGAGTGVTVGANEPISVGANGWSFDTTFSSSIPLYRLFFLPVSNTFVPGVAALKVHVAEFNSPDGHTLLVTTAGTGDARRQLNAQLISVERR